DQQIAEHAADEPPDGDTGAELQLGHAELGGDLACHGDMILREGNEGEDDDPDVPFQDLGDLLLPLHRVGYLAGDCADLVDTAVRLHHGIDHRDHHDGTDDDDDDAKKEGKIKGFGGGMNRCLGVAE